MEVNGVCKLTLKRGRFVESHLIPRALMPLDVRANPAMQYSVGRKPIRRRNSWYDKSLVIADGEKVLERIDSAAISELRKHRLVWSGWGKDLELGDLHHPIADSGWGVRRIENLNQSKIRVFLLSLLWRAAATDRFEFRDVTVSAEQLERLRKMILADEHQPVGFFPMQLTQYSTRGPTHNLAPIRDSVRVPQMDGSGTLSNKPIFRFYFDGLVVHIGTEDLSVGPVAELGNLVLGAESNLIVSTQTYQGSMQRDLVTKILSDVASTHSG